jgi:hypothetical protein
MWDITTLILKGLATTVVGIICVEGGLRNGLKKR